MILEPVEDRMELSITICEKYGKVISPREIDCTLCPMFNCCHGDNNTNYAKTNFITLANDFIRVHNRKEKLKKLLSK